MTQESERKHLLPISEKTKQSWRDTFGCVDLFVVGPVRNGHGKVIKFGTELLAQIDLDAIWSESQGMEKDSQALARRIDWKAEIILSYVWAHVEELNLHPSLLRMIFQIFWATFVWGKISLLIRYLISWRINSLAGKFKSTFELKS